MNITTSGTYQIGGTSFTVKLGAAIEVSLRQVNLRPREADGFLQVILGSPDKLISIGSLLSWSSAAGPNLGGLPGDTFVVPLNQKAGIVELKTLTLHFERAGAGVVLTAGFDGTGTLGPFKVAVQNAGIQVAITPQAGTVQIDPRFKPPAGLGLVVDVGPITGGGFLSIDAPNGRYAGILELQVFGIAIKAIGLIDTKVPGGFSFLIILTAEFQGLQIGFGFTLNGVGGIFGLYRSVQTDPLRNAVLGHRIDHILFARDPVAHAAEIISDLREIFPPAAGQFVFGPMAKLGWGTPTIVEAELGIILNLPAGIFVLLGQLSAFVPLRDAAIIELHLDFDGTFDPPQKTLSLTASLHDSRIAIYTLRGDMAFQIKWGDQPSFLFSLGGFHPNFQPPPAFPGLARLSLDLGFGNNPRLSMQNYIAVTSNSYQFGAKAELYAAAGPFNLHGWFGFDALFIFSPFSFVVDFDAGIEFREGTNVLAGLHVHASLSGPRPWHVDGEACISLFLFDACVGFSATIGDATPVVVPPADVKAALKAAIEEPHNWSAEPPPGFLQVVTLHPPASDAAKLLIDPVGGAKLEQRSVPLNEVIAKFAETKIDPPVKFHMTALSAGGGDLPVPPPFVRDLFARAQFEQLSDQQKLSLPSFEPMDGGFRVSSNAATEGDAQRDDIQYKTIIYDAPNTPRFGSIYTMGASMQTAFAEYSAVAESAIHSSGERKYAAAGFKPALVNLAEESYVVASMADLTVNTAITHPVSKGAAFRALADHVAANPAAAGTLQVVAMHEATQPRMAVPPS